MKALAIWAGIIVMVLSFGCGGGGGGSSSGGTSGVFLDSAVGGLNYTSGSITDVTDAQGTFHWEGDQITFSIGGIVIGSSVPYTHMTPVTLVNGATDETHPEVTNIARFLLTMDDDGVPENGITITASIREAAELMSVNFGVSVEEFENSATVQNVVAQLTALTSAGQHTLFETQAAQNHLRATLESLIPPDPTSCSGSNKSWAVFNFTPYVGEPFTIKQCATFHNSDLIDVCTLNVYVLPGDEVEGQERFFQYLTPFGVCYGFAAKVGNDSYGAFYMDGDPLRTFGTGTGPYAIGYFSPGEGAGQGGEPLGTFEFFEYDPQ